jgi:hypothetical protein
MISMNSDHECNLNKEIVTFPGITLFYDKEKNAYQEKPV